MNDVNMTNEHRALHEQALALAFEFHRIEAELNEIIDRLYETSGVVRRDLENSRAEPSRKTTWSERG